MHAHSERLYVFSLPAFGALRHLELHSLPFLKTLEPPRLDCREMHKNILAALTTDEAVAFGVVEPLHRSLFCHIDTRVPLIDLRWRDSEVLKAGYWLVGRELLTTDSIKRTSDLTRRTHDWQSRPDSRWKIMILLVDSDVRAISNLPGRRATLPMLVGSAFMPPEIAIDKGETGTKPVA